MRPAAGRTIPQIVLPVFSAIKTNILQKNSKNVGKVRKNIQKNGNIHVLFVNFML